MANQLAERTVRASNLNFHVLEMGTRPLVLCLHGFPDPAYSFRHQMSALAAAGYHAAAPFMRGYAPTDPTPDGRYDWASLSEDAIALIGRDAILLVSA
jgi:pimeloyl-ACP methyl ester carboxylesterase